MQFEYFYVTQVNATIDVDDVGNCCLLARNDIGLEYLLYVKTEYGKTELVTVGPLYIDEDVLYPNTVTVEYNTFDYDIKKIAKIINKFLSNAKASITFVEEVEPEVFKERCPNFSKLVV